jgi:hypothetical protein
MPLDEDEIQDLACDYVEQEVGRHDWQNNWLKRRGENDEQKNIEVWLRRIGENEGAAEPIMLWLDGLAKRMGRSKWL